MKLLNKIKASKLLDNIIADRDTLNFATRVGEEILYTYGSDIEGNNLGKTYKDEVDLEDFTTYVEHYCPIPQTSDKILQFIEYFFKEWYEYKRYRQTESSEHLLGYCAFLVLYKLTTMVEYDLGRGRGNNSKHGSEKDWKCTSLKDIDIKTMFMWELPQIKKDILNTIVKPWTIDNSEIADFIKRLEICKNTFAGWKERYKNKPVFFPFGWDNTPSNPKTSKTMEDILRNDIKHLYNGFSLDSLHIREIERMFIIEEECKKMDLEVEEKYKKKECS